MKQSLRYQLAECLRDVGIALDSALFAIADRIAPFDDGKTPAERDLWNEATLAKIFSRRDHPCPDCAGKGAILVPDGPEKCPACKGTGIDPAYIAS